MKLIDLHIHSKKSDGSLTPIELVHHALKIGLSAFAITDHDTVSGVQEAIDEGKKVDIEVIAGLECSCDNNIHMLGLNVDHKNEHLLYELKDIEEKRRLSYFKTIENLNKLGVNITYEDLVKVAGGEIILRPHIELALMNIGYTQQKATDVLEEVKNRFGYQVRRILKLKEAIGLIEEADGIPILAHPGSLNKSKKQLSQIIYELKEIGLKGIEVYYSKHTQGMISYLELMAEQHGLLMSGGSDFHGELRKHIKMGEGLGNLKINYDLINKMKSSQHWKRR